MGNPRRRAIGHWLVHIRKSRGHMKGGAWGLELSTKGEQKVLARISLKKSSQGIPHCNSLNKFEN